MCTGRRLKRSSSSSWSPFFIYVPQLNLYCKQRDRTPNRDRHIPTPGRAKVSVSRKSEQDISSIATSLGNNSPHKIRGFHLWETRPVFRFAMGQWVGNVSCQAVTADRLTGITILELVMYSTRTRTQSPELEDGNRRSHCIAENIQQGWTALQPPFMSTLSVQVFSGCSNQPVKYEKNRLFF